MKECWKNVNGFENLYEVSNYGNVRSFDRIIYQKNKIGGLSKHIYRGKNIKLRIQKSGYVTVDLHKQGTFKRFLVHRLVAEHFLEKINGKNYINHIDNNPLNNCVDNLEWCTQSENVQYAYDQGRKIAPHQKKVEQYDIDGNFVKLWKSASFVEKEIGIKQANISKVCRGERKKAGGYLWKFAQ